MNSLLKCFIICYCMVWALMASAEDAVGDMPEKAAQNNVTVTMRDTGYTIGDTIDMVATFTLPRNHFIDEESLPLVGRVNHWLDIQSLDFSQDARRAKLHIKWQLFATVEIAQQLNTPQVVLKTSGENPQTITIPQQAFYYSPVLPMPLLKDISRRVDLTPPDFDEVQPLVHLSYCLVVLLIVGLAWLWLKDMLPWLPYEAGPMTKLSRQLKVQSTHFTQTQLRDIHAALNNSAGVSLYPHNLSQLFMHAPYFDGEQHNIKLFFDQSWQQFYRNEVVEAEAVEVLHHLAWIKRAAVAERLFRRQQKAKK